MKARGYATTRILSATFEQQFLAHRLRPFCSGCANYAHHGRGFRCLRDNKTPGNARLDVGTMIDKIPT